MMRNTALVAVVAVIMALFPAIFIPVANAATPEDAKAYASNIGDQVLAVMNDPQLADKEKLAKLEMLFVEVVDVNWVGRFVLGRHWRALDEEKRMAYLNAYEVFLIKHYTSRFAEYSGETFTIEHTEQRRTGEYMVRMNIQRPRGQEPVIVDYMLRENGSSFKVFDIVVEGVSLISTQRSEFGSVVERKGIDSLIDALETKTRMLDEQTAKDLQAKEQ